MSTPTAPPTAPPAEVVLSVRDLRTYFRTPSGVARAVDGISFDLRRGETVGLVGESGCGKSITSLSILGLVPRPGGFHPSGQILFGGEDLLRQPEAALRKIRGNRISMVFQEPMTSLNPIFRVGDQITEALWTHRRLSRVDARGEAIRLLERVGVSDPGRRVDDFPHQMSGGMKQRVMIAMALACGPEVLVADEPTTALDVTIQAQILDLLRGLQAESRMAILLVTHDLGVVAEMADRVVVMYAGQVVESGPVDAVLTRPRHPYTQGLLRSLPDVDAPRAGRLVSIPGTVPRAADPLAGCRFHNRCAYVRSNCRASVPALETAEPGVQVTCHHHADLKTDPIKHG